MNGRKLLSDTYTIVGLKRASSGCFGGYHNAASGFFFFFLIFVSFLFHTALADSFFCTESPDLWLDKDQMVNLGPERL